MSDKQTTTQRRTRMAALLLVAVAVAALCTLPAQAEAARSSGSSSSSGRVRRVYMDTFSGIPAVPWRRSATAAVAPVSDSAAKVTLPSSSLASASLLPSGTQSFPAGGGVGVGEQDSDSDLDDSGDNADDADGHLPWWPNLFAKFMAASYLALFVLAGVQLFRTIVHRHKIRSFRFGFLLVCWLWTALRVLFWFIVTLTTWPTWLSHLIYFLPNACQIGTFSLLILFYAKLVHRHRWRGLRLRFLSFCILANTALVLLTLTFSILMDRVQKAQQSDPTSTAAANVKEFVNKLYFLVCAVFFGVLVVLAAFYIYQLRTARRSTAGTSRQEVVLTSGIFVIFLSRCVWDFLAAFDSSSSIFRQGLWETTDRHVKLMNVSTFFLLFIWEIIPTLMIIVYFRNIPSTTDSYCVGLWAWCPRVGRRLLQSWPCRFPNDYFERAESSGGASPGGTMLGAGDDSSPDTAGAGSAGDEPPYHGMRDTDTGGSSSLLLPPGSFVPSNSAALSHAQLQYAAGSVGVGSLQHGAHHGGLGLGFGPAMQIGNLSQQGQGAGPPLGLGLPHNMTGSLYGSPTWLNAHHPALANLTPSPAHGYGHAHANQHSVGHAQQQPQLQQQQQYQPPTPQHHSSHSSSSVTYTQLAGVGGSASVRAQMYDEDYRLEQYGAHPYTQQQQQLAAQQAQMAAQSQQPSRTSAQTQRLRQ